MRDARDGVAADARRLFHDPVLAGVVPVVSGVDDDSVERGYRLTGDVDYNQALEVAGYLTPVPGGVGPMTIAMLLRNTVRAAKLADKK